MRDPGDDAPPVFLRLLLAGALEPLEYAELLVQYHEIYAVLDRAAAAHAADDPLLRRLRAGIQAGLEDLEADLAVLLGPAWADADAEVMPATRVYSACASAAASSVEGLVAHHLRLDARAARARRRRGVGRRSLRPRTSRRTRCGARATVINAD